MARRAVKRLPPLDGPALRVALIEGLKFYVMCRSGALHGQLLTEIVDHQMSAIRSAARREANPHTAPANCEAPTPAAANDDVANRARLWWLEH